jgi:hypothetical protein
MGTRMKPKMDGRRISPQGMITLPFITRSSLGFGRGQNVRVDIVVDEGGVRLSPSQVRSPNSRKVSPGGLLQLTREAHAALADGGKGRYSCEIADDGKTIYLRPVR